MEEEIYFDGSIHANRLEKEFDIFAEENAHVLENLLVTVDGTICGVKSAVVLPHLQDPEVRKIRMGAAPSPRSVKIENADDLYKLLALYVPLSVYY
jgi:hypothetical protein